MIKLELDDKKMFVKVVGTKQEILQQTAIGIATIIEKVSDDDKDFDACMEYLKQLINSIDYEDFKDMRNHTKYEDKAICRHREYTERVQKRKNILKACGIIVAVAVIAALLAGAGRTERKYTEDTVMVHSGDTLWGIAEQYCPEDMDKREYIRMIREDNDCTANIRNGDILTIRVYEEK